MPLLRTWSSAVQRLRSTLKAHRPALSLHCDPIPEYSLHCNCLLYPTALTSPDLMPVRSCCRRRTTCSATCSRPATTTTTPRTLPAPAHLMCAPLPPLRPQPLASTTASAATRPEVPPQSGWGASAQGATDTLAAAWTVCCPRWQQPTWRRGWTMPPALPHSWSGGCTMRRTRSQTR